MLVVREFTVAKHIVLYVFTKILVEGLCLLLKFELMFK
jgi:hypothetical protein